MSVPSINVRHLTVSEIQAGQTFSHRPPTHPDMGENNTLTALKGCGVKIILKIHKKIKTDPGLILTQGNLLIA